MLVDVYARAILILRAFGSQCMRLTPLWASGVWVGATLSWLLRPFLYRRTPAVEGKGLGYSASLFGLFVGAVLGLLSPFSLLSLVGLVRGLLHKQRLAPLVVGFSLASTLLDPTMLTFTGLALGLGFAWVRATTALGAVIVAGLVILLWARRSPASHSPAPGGDPMPEKLEMSRTVAGYLRHLGSQIYICGRHYLLALLLTAWIGVLLPLNALLPLLGQDSRMGVLIAAGMGGPLYVCGGGAVVLVDGLLKQGMSNGAALAYLTFGPATTVRALTALSAILGRRAVVVFVIGTVVVAILAGYLLNLHGQVAMPLGHPLTTWAKTAFDMFRRL